MGLQIRRARLDDAPAIGRLNARLRAGGVTAPVYAPEPDVPVVDGTPYESYYVVADGEEIRGSVYLRRSRLWIGQRSVPIGWIKYPVAESLVAPRFAGVPAAMILHLQRELPTLFAVGMGGLDGQFAKLLSALRWTGGVVPTYVLPVDPLPVLTQLPHLAARTRMRRVASALQAVGADAPARLALRTWSRLRTRAAGSGVDVALCASPDERWDALFDTARHQYPALAERTRACVTWAVPPTAPGVRYWGVSREGALIGWAAVQQLDFTHARHRPYGALRVGIVHDMLAAPGDAAAVLPGVVRALVDDGVQLLLANHSAPSWRTAFRAVGFREAPASFACLASPALSAELSAVGLTPTDVYMTRGDDGVLTPESDA